MIVFVAAIIDHAAAETSPAGFDGEALELKEGDEIEIHVADARRFAIARKPGRENLLKRLRAFRGRLPADFKFDRDEVNAR
jgi:antitoxin MazE